MANIHAPRLSMGQRPAARSRTVVPAIAARFSLAGLFDKTAVRGEKKQKVRLGWRLQDTVLWLPCCQVARHLLAAIKTTGL